MPLSTHSGAGDPAVFQGPELVALMSIESGGWFSRRAAHLLIFAGVFERHPELKLVLTEQPGEWWPTMAAELDSVHRANTGDGWPARPPGAPLPERVPAPQRVHRRQLPLPPRGRGRRPRRLRRPAHVGLRLPAHGVDLAARPHRLLTVVAPLRPGRARRGHRPGDRGRHRDRRVRPRRRPPGRRRRHASAHRPGRAERTARRGARRGQPVRVPHRGAWD